MKLSIVVTSYDLRRRRDIINLLDSIRAQTCDDFEVVYVTERSRLLYDFVKEEIKKRGIRGKVVYNEGNWGLSECRNIGVVHSEGEIVAFVDDDVTLDVGWASVIKNSFEFIDDMVGATGPAIPNWRGVPADWLPVELDWLIGCTRWLSSERPIPVRNCWGMNMCFRKYDIRIVGGFSNSTGYHRGELAEDVDLSLRIRQATSKKLYYLPGMKVSNAVYPYRLRSRFIIERSIWIGHSRHAIKRNSHLDEGFSFERSILIGMLKALFRTGRLSSRSDLVAYVKRVEVIIMSLLAAAVGYALGGQIFKINGNSNPSS
jgi:glycosyltransferase involved in cell wall biosynthesis